MSMFFSSYVDCAFAYFIWCSVPNRHPLLDSYQIFMIYCIIRLTTVMPIQQDAPSRIGLPPDFTILTTLLFKPIAAIAIMMKNLDNSFSGANTSALTPRLLHIVVIIAAMIKYRINIGNARFRLKFLVDLPSLSLIHI